MTGRLPRGLNLSVLSNLGAMGSAGLLFFGSVLLLLVMIAAALISTLGSIFFGGWALPVVAWSWIGLCVAAYNVVRAIELINAPDWRGIGWILGRAVLILLPIAFLGLTNFG